MALISPHLVKLAAAGEEAETAQKVVLSAAEYFSNQYGRTSLAIMAAKISEGNSKISKPVQERLVEATVTPPQLQMRLSAVNTPTPQKDDWYVVLASLPGDQLETAKAEANEKLTKAREKGLDQRVQLYKTKISNNYAVVIGGSLDKVSARALSAKARTVRLAEDSFSAD